MIAEPLLAGDVYELGSRVVRWTSCGCEHLQITMSSAVLATPIFKHTQRSNMIYIPYRSTCDPGFKILPACADTKRGAQLSLAASDTHKLILFPAEPAIQGLSPVCFASWAGFPRTPQQGYADRQSAKSYRWEHNQPVVRGRLHPTTCTVSLFPFSSLLAPFNIPGSLTLVTNSVPFIRVCTSRRPAGRAGTFKDWHY